MSSILKKEAYVTTHQRAFRTRKEGYIKKLEEQVRDMNALEENYKVVQNENYSLREYIIHLQSRLLESQGEFPQPPPNVNLSHPRQDTNASMGLSAIDQLQASAAQAVAGLGNGKHQAQEAYMGGEPAKQLSTTTEDGGDMIRLQPPSVGLPPI